MSKTYRDQARGRYRRAQDDWDNNPDNYVYCRRKLVYYRLRPWKEIGTPFNESYREVKWIEGKHWRHDRDKLKPWHDLTWKEKKLFDVDYSKNPSWWNKLYTHRPSRRRSKNILRKYIGVKIFDAEADHQCWPARKPNIYYW